jgi:hypothetical protein
MPAERTQDKMDVSTLDGEHKLLRDTRLERTD